MSRKRVVLLLIFLFFCLLTNSLCFLPINSVQTENHAQIFNLGLIIYDLNATEREWCMKWISQFDPFAKWNFILWPPYKNLEDATFVNFLKTRGLLICAEGYMQLKPLSQRESELDSTVNTFNAHNITLKGLFMFQPDTYTMNYAYSKYNFEYYVGYCFEQYVIDYMTMKGGWQLPYYHNSEHALKPSETSDGLVVFPHVIWDWVSSLTYSHFLNTHILDAYPQIYPDPSQAVTYCLKLINESLSCSEPFGYATTMFEWMWIINRQDFNETATDYYQKIINQHGSICQLYNETTSWFKAHYPKTPTYQVKFTSPYDGQKVEWYLDLNYRIARLENHVKSYIIFKNQTEYWSNHICYVDFGKPANETNCADNSLEFEIDDLGGGYLRDSSKGGSEYYTGNLADFPAFYIPCTLSVSTLKNDVPIASDITLFNENIAAIDAIKNVSSYKWLLHRRIYYVQASIFYKAHTCTSENVRVNLTEDTELAINFSYGNLTISCVDIENSPLTNCTVICRRQDEEYIGRTNEFGRLPTLEAYYGNWTVKAYRMGVLVGEENTSINQSTMNLSLQCNVGDLTVSAVDKYGESAEASVFLRNDKYDLTFSGVILKPMKNITFTQIPLINYTLTIEDNYETQTYTVDTSQTRQICTTLTRPTEIAGITLSEIVILVGAIVGLIAALTFIKKEAKKLMPILGQPT